MYFSCVAGFPQCTTVVIKLIKNINLATTDLIMPMIYASVFLFVSCVAPSAILFVLFLVVFLVFVYFYRLILCCLFVDWLNLDRLNHCNYMPGSKFYPQIFVWTKWLEVFSLKTWLFQSWFIFVPLFYWK